MKVDNKIFSIVSTENISFEYTMLANLLKAAEPWKEISSFSAALLPFFANHGLLSGDHTIMVSIHLVKGCHGQQFNCDSRSRNKAMKGREGLSLKPKTAEQVSAAQKKHHNHTLLHTSGSLDVTEVYVKIEYHDRMVFLKQGPQN